MGGKGDAGLGVAKKAQGKTSELKKPVDKGGKSGRKEGNSGYITRSQQGGKK